MMKSTLPEGGSKMYLLLVDQNVFTPDDLKSLKESLPAATDVVHSYSADTLIKLAEKVNPAVVIVDFALTGEAAEELLQRVRAKSGSAHLLALIDGTDYALLNRAIEAGVVDDYMLKPLRREEFIARMRMAGQRQSEKQAALAGLSAAEPLAQDIAAEAVTPDIAAEPLAQDIATEAVAQDTAAEKVADAEPELKLEAPAEFIFPAEDSLEPEPLPQAKEAAEDDDFLLSAEAAQEPAAEEGELQASSAFQADLNGLSFGDEAEDLAPATPEDPFGLVDDFAPATLSEAAEEEALFAAEPGAAEEPHLFDEEPLLPAEDFKPAAQEPDLFAHEAAPPAEEAALLDEELVPPVEEPGLFADEAAPASSEAALFEEDEEDFVPAAEEPAFFAEEPPLVKTKTAFDSLFDDEPPATEPPAVTPAKESPAVAPDDLFAEGLTPENPPPLLFEAAEEADLFSLAEEEPTVLAEEFSFDEPPAPFKDEPAAPKEAADSIVGDEIFDELSGEGLFEEDLFAEAQEPKPASIEPATPEPAPALKKTPLPGPSADEFLFGESHEADYSQVPESVRRYVEESPQASAESAVHGETAAAPAPAPAALKKRRAAQKSAAAPKKEKAPASGFKKVLNIIGNVVFILLLLAMAALSFFLIQSKLSGGAPKVAGHQMYIVLSGSMNPAFDTGSLAFVKETKPEEIVVGDIITFRTQSESDALTTHRVVEVLRDGELAFVTRGDANNVNDPYPVLADNVVGRVTGAVPYVGYALNFVQTRQGLILLIFIPGVLIILFELGKIIKYITEGDRGKKKQDSYALPPGSDE